ncbi:hypothetical protein Hanom_Chr03g00228911 [Helianthus anomalus]
MIYYMSVRFGSVMVGIEKSITNRPTAFLFGSVFWINSVFCTLLYIIMGLLNLPTIILF